MSLQKFISALKSFDVENELLKVVRNNEDVILDLTREDQLFQKGIDSLGNKLPTPYAPFTIEIKQAKGQPTDRITLRDEGDFHNAFFLRANNFPIVIDSSDSKRNELAIEWGEDIFGLTEDSLFETRKDVLPDFQKVQRKKLGI
jgi:hypothetical protein